jgi:hypothetical protein
VTAGAGTGAAPPSGADVVTLDESLTPAVALQRCSTGCRFGVVGTGQTRLPSLVVATTTSDLAAALGVSEGDVEVLLGQLGVSAARLPNELASFLRSVLDPHGERTAPTGLYWPGAEPVPRRRYGLGGPDPTSPEGAG